MSEDTSAGTPIRNGVDKDERQEDKQLGTPRKIISMKTRLIIIAAMLVSLTAAAQTAQSYNMYGDNNEIQKTISWNGIRIPDNIVLGVKIIVENATLGGLSYSDRVLVDPELETDFKDIVRRCAEGANKRFQRSNDPHPVYFVPITEGRDYLVTFIIRSVTAQGYTISDVWIDTPSGEQAQITGLRGPGGRYGTFVNLMGDGIESLGSELAKLICKARNQKKI
jgi:hypothetical protein